MNYCPDTYLVIALISGWSNYDGSLSNILIEACSPAEAVLKRMESCMSKQDGRFCVVNENTNEAVLVDYTAPLNTGTTTVVKP